MGLISLLGGVIDVKRGLKPILGKSMTLARERMKSRKLRRQEVPKEKAKHEIMAAREKGIIGKVEKGAKKLAKVVHREDRMIFQILGGEERIEYDAIKDLERCEEAVNKSRATNKDAVMKRLRAIAKTFESLSELELGKMAYLQKGGTPWEGMVNIASFSLGTTINVVLGEAVNQRSRVIATKNTLKLVSKYANSIYAEMRAKVPRVDRIKQYMEKQELAMKKLEDVVNRELMPSFRLQFFCVLRVLDFMQKESQQDRDLFDVFMKEGFPQDKAKKLKDLFMKELNGLNKKEGEEVKKFAIIAGEDARAA